MSIRVKNDSLFWKDSEGHYQTTAVFSEMLPTEVESIKNTAVAAVNSAGTIQVGNVNTAGGNQVSAVESAGTTQVGLVNQAGSDQVDAVEDAGAAQITAINNILSQLQADITDLQDRVTALENA